MYFVRDENRSDPSQPTLRHTGSYATPIVHGNNAEGSIPHDETQNDISDENVVIEIECRVYTEEEGRILSI